MKISQAEFDNVAVTEFVAIVTPAPSDESQQDRLDRLKIAARARTLAAAVAKSEKTE